MRPEDYEAAVASEVKRLIAEMPNVELRGVLVFSASDDVGISLGITRRVALKMRIGENTPAQAARYLVTTLLEGEKR